MGSKKVLPKPLLMLARGKVRNWDTMRRRSK